MSYASLMLRLIRICIRRTGVRHCAYSYTHSLVHLIDVPIREDDVVYRTLHHPYDKPWYRKVIAWLPWIAFFAVAPLIVDWWRTLNYTTSITNHVTTCSVNSMNHSIPKRWGCLAHCVRNTLRQQEIILLFDNGTGCPPVLNINLIHMYHEGRF